MEHTITIPHCYKWMAKGNKKLYLQYVKGYVARSHPDLQPVRIEGHKVICKVK